VQVPKVKEEDLQPQIPRARKEQRQEKELNKVISKNNTYEAPLPIHLPLYLSVYNLLH
jgi:hypothetical protein